MSPRRPASRTTPLPRSRPLPPRTDPGRVAGPRVAASARWLVRSALLACVLAAAGDVVAPTNALAVVVPGGPITSNTSFSGPPGTVYQIQGAITIQNGKVLSVSPGVIVEIDNGTFPGARIIVGSASGGSGTLSAAGSPPVVFRAEVQASTPLIDFTANTVTSNLDNCDLGTSLLGTGVPVRCTGIGAADLIIKNCRFHNCPSTALTLVDASPDLKTLVFQGTFGGPDILCSGSSSPALTSCSFQSVSHEGLVVSGTGVPQMTSCAFVGGGPWAMRVPPASIQAGAFTLGVSYPGVFVNPTGSAGPGQVTSSTTWPSLLPGRVYQLGGPVFIEGGATLSLAPGTIVNGGQFICGDPLNPTNGGSLVAIGTESQHILLSGGAGIDVSDGPSGLQLIYVESSAVVVVRGAHAAPSTVTLDRCRLASAGPWSVIGYSGAHLTISNSSIQGGGVSAQDNTCDITATGNWWNAASGPHDPSPGPPSYNPGGLGAEVTDYVSYEPYLTQPACLGPRTISASAGPNGGISPRGTVSVPCGSSQTFTITPDLGYAVADVIVDGASVGAVGSYTFPPSSVQVNHGINASFAMMNPVHAVAVNACISAAESCAQVPVVFDYVGTAPVRLFTVTLALGGGLELCGGISGVVEGPYLASAGSTQFFVVDLGGGRYTVDGAILGLPCGAQGPGTLFTLSVGSSVPAGVGTITIESVTVRDCSNAGIVAGIGPPAQVGIDNLPLTGVADLVAARVKSGNGTSGRTGIALTFTPPANAATVEIYRAGYGQYPEYDDAGGGVPAVPGYPPPAPWVLTGVTASGGVDMPPIRDFWYHVVFFKDACGQVSAVSNMTAGALDYHLGDVSDGITAGTGNNVVATEDLSALGAHYGAAAPAGCGFEYLDVGPTTDYSVDARPTTDDVVNFEDLAMFAINYGQVSGPAARARPAPSAPGAVEQVAVSAPGLVAAGESFDAVIQLNGGGKLQMLSVVLGWDVAVAEPVAVDTTPWLAAQDGVALSPRPGAVDVALLGPRSPGFTGTGNVAVVHFHARAGGAPALQVAAVSGRSSTNTPVPVAMNTLSSPRPMPTRTALAAITPTPSTGTARLSYTLARGGRVTLALHAVDGRRVRLLADGEREPGEYDVTWDGRDAGGHTVSPGVYFVRLEAPGASFTRRLVFVR